MVKIGKSLSPFAPLQANFLLSRILEKIVLAYIHLSMLHINLKDKVLHTFWLTKKKKKALLINLRKILFAQFLSSQATDSYNVYETTSWFFFLKKRYLA